jgi:5-methylcytosine-specific restriction enzyme subunit McrC
MLLYSNTTTFTKEDFIPFNKITEIAHHECGLVKFLFWIQITET